MTAVHRPAKRMMPQPVGSPEACWADAHTLCTPTGSGLRTFFVTTKPALVTCERCTRHD